MMAGKGGNRLFELVGAAFLPIFSVVVPEKHADIKTGLSHIRHQLQEGLRIRNKMVMQCVSNIFLFLAAKTQGVLLRNFQTKVYCLRSTFLASEVYFLAQYQYICVIFIVVLAMAIILDLLL